MKSYIILFFILIITGEIYAQKVTVLDETTKLPLDRAVITNEDASNYVLTNSKGIADISVLEGAEKYIFQMTGYKKLSLTFKELREREFKVFLESKSYDLDEVVVSATRWQQLTSNVPQEIITITPREVELQNPQTAADLLSISGEVFVQKSQQGGGSPMIRGFATNRLLYTIDGVRMNTAIFRGGNIQNVISLDPFAIEHTEVLFGPGSVIYGSDAIGGVMSFQTITPRFSQSDEKYVTGKAAARYSSINNENTGHFDINVGWNKWAFVTSITSFDFENLVQGNNGPDDYVKPYHVERINGTDVIVEQDNPLLQIPSAYSQKNFMQKVRFKPNPLWDFEYGFHYSETSSYGRYDRHNRVKNGLPRYGEWDYGPQKWMMNNLNIWNKADNTFYSEMSVRLAQQYFEESRISRNFNSSDRETRKEKVDAYSVNIDFMKSFDEKNTLFYGAEYVLNDVTSTGIDENILTGSTAPGSARYPQATWQSFAGYVNAEHVFSHKFLMQAGVRYNQFIINADFDTTFYPFPFSSADLNKGSITGSIGAVLRPVESWIISTNLSTAFRSPNVDDIGKVFDSEPGAVTVPNPDLEAEYAYNADLSIAKVFGDVAKIDVSGFYTNLQNALVRRNFTLNGKDSIYYDGVLSRVQAIQNAATARVYGVRAVLEIKLPYGFNFLSDISYQKGEEELDDGTTSPSRHASPMFGVTRLSFSAERTELQLYAMYQAERKHEDMSEEEKGKTEIYALDENGNTYAPGWYTLNLKALYRLTDVLTVSAGIENITDQRYRPYSSGISGPGRNFILSLRADF